MNLKGSSILWALVILVCCCHLVSSYETFACHAACLNCSSSDPNYYYTCRNSNNCSFGFKSTNASSAMGAVNCTTQDRYTGVYNKTNLTLTQTPITPSCTDAFYASITQYGQFSGGTAVKLWQYSTPLPHYFKIRVIVSIVFMNWNVDSNYMSILFNSTSKKNLTYGAMPNLGSGKTYCGVSRFGSLDTSDLEEHDVDIDIVVQPVGGNNWLMVNAMILIQKCHYKCAICGNSSNTNCTQCATVYMLSGNVCDDDCLPGFFQNGTNTCDSCQTNCSNCVNITSNCTVCFTGFVLFPPNTSCLGACPTLPTPYYFDPTLNACNACHPNCKLCSDEYVNCSQCQNNFFNLDNSCLATCPYPLIDDKVRWKCQDCEVYCVRMTIAQYIPTGGDGLVPLFFDVNFTYAIDWPTFNYSQFESLVFAGAIFSTSNMNISYFNISSKAFRISIQPFSYAFIINQSVTLTIRSQPDPAVFNYTSSDTRPFHSSVFNQSLSVTWTYLKPPSMTDTEYNMISTLSTFSNTVNNAFIGPGVQEVKKFGFLLLILNSIQITSCLLLLNVILPQNLYEGIRFFASLVFYDVPNWQAESVGTKYFFAAPNKNYQNQSRRLLEIILDQFGFRRTGFSGVFVFDTYWQILMIILCYILLGVALLIARYWKRIQKAVPYFYSALNAFHQIAIMYFTLCIVYQFVYMNGSTLKWVSAGICIFINIYYFLYQIRIYYVLLQFPSTSINDPKFQLYVLKYSYYLKYLRFDQEQGLEGRCSIVKFIVKPHNYHILSYIKKFLMMLTFPLFYHFPFCQISILIALQIFQLVRISISRPYLQRWRNIAKIFLEALLLLLFVLILFIELLVVFITNQSVNVNLTWAHLYFVIGWIGFALVFVFNFGYFLIFTLNWYKNCTSSNREILEESRRVYYLSLYNSYEEQHKAVSLGLLNEWVKKGNLNKRNIQQLPTIEFRIESYQMIRKKDHYQLNFKNIFSLCMDSEYNFKEEDNNVIPTDELEGKSMKVDTSHDLYPTILFFFKKYGDEKSTSISLKTFLSIEQKEYKFGQRIQMNQKDMHQEIEVRSPGENSEENISVERITLLDGFPIKKKLLLSCFNRYSP